MFQSKTQGQTRVTRFSADETIEAFGNNRWHKPALGIKLPTYKQISTSAEKFLSQLKKTKGSNKGITFHQIREVKCPPHLIKAEMKLSKDENDISLFTKYIDIVEKSKEQELSDKQMNLVGAANLKLAATIDGNRPPQCEHCHGWLTLRSKRDNSLLYGCSCKKTWRNLCLLDY